MELDEEFDLEEEGDAIVACWHQNGEAVEKIMIHLHPRCEFHHHVT